MPAVLDMANKILLHDGWLYLGAAAFLTASTFGIRYAIIDVISLIKIETAQPFPKPEEITVSGEVHNSAEGGSLTIKISTLRSLLKSPSDSISGSARCIIVQRCCFDPTNVRGLVSDVFSVEKATYTRATVAVKYLLENTVTHPSWNEARTVIPYQARGILELLAMVDRTKYVITTACEAAAAEQAFWDINGREARNWAGLQSRLQPRRTHLRKSGDGNGTSTSSTLRSSTRPVAAAQSRRQRRHREVMVLHDGDDAVSEQDIYQRL